MRHYDYIISGGGCAGLSLAYRLNETILRDKSVLIVDAEEKVLNDRTWCFWTAETPPFSEIVYRQWSQIEFVDPKFQQTAKLSDLKYHMIRGIDFYEHTRESLSKNPNVHWLQGKIEDIRDFSDGAAVTVNGVEYSASWVFNSIYLPALFQLNQRHSYYLLQHFKGWEIECNRDVFDPGTVRMMDFRTEQDGDVKFFYILPFSPRKALVEYTIFSPQLLPEEEYDHHLKDYISRQLNIENYRILSIEQNAIPMTNQSFPRAPGKHIINIGIAGGRCKPSTGYAFLQIQRDVENIVDTLLRKSHPFAPICRAPRFHFYDTLLLHIMAGQHYSIRKIFRWLFRHNPLPRVLAFLDERTSLFQEILIFSRLPWLPFLRAVYQTRLPRRSGKTAARTWQGEAPYAHPRETVER